jgi:NAD(P)-dependent dehydrogenase (short-subunit alcohol dehydrogenase family)
MTPHPDAGPGRVAGKAALVTGAASGIGRATAILLARHGARVAVADLDDPGSSATVEAITSAGGTTFAQHLDVTSEADWQAATDAVVAGWGRLDVLVNCAGISVAAPVADTTLDEWRRVLAVNLDGVFLGTRAALRAMRATRRGSIVNVASVSGLKASPGASAYCASKAAVLHFTRTAALECANQGDNVRVNCVAPGAVKTPMWSKMPFWADVAAGPAWNAPPDAAPLKRFAEPEEVARAILFLASDESSYVTGAALVIDGGYSA